MFYIANPFALEEISYLPPLSRGWYAINGHIHGTQTPTRHDTTSEVPKQLGSTNPREAKTAKLVE